MAAGPGSPDLLDRSASRDAGGGTTLLARRLLEDVRRKSGIRHERAVERKLERILAVIPPAALDGWVELIEASPADSPDWLSLIESLTVHETYFFRDPPQQEQLRRTVLPALIKAAEAEGRRSLRLWSAGCASGEEPYTLAILALEALADLRHARRTGAGVETDWTVDVLGTDISRHMVTLAKGGAYGGEGLGPFRDLPPEYLPWFVPLEDQAHGLRRVRADAKRLVRFRQHNLVSDMPPEAGFDLVCCRNVLIYFDEEGRRRAQAQLVSSLAPGGWLVLGASDRPDRPELFERIMGERALAYRLRGAPR